MPPETKRLSLRDLWRFMAPYLRANRGLLWLLGACLGAGLALTLAGPLLLRRFIDLSLGGGPEANLTGIAAAFLLIALATQGVGIATAWIATDLSSRTTNRLRSELTDHVLSLDMSFHRRTPPGELIERVDGDVGSLGVLLGNFVPQMIQEALLLIGVLALLWGIDPRLGGALTAYAVVAVVVLSRLRHLGVRAWEDSRETAAKSRGFEEEALGATEDVRPNGASQHVVLRFLELNRRVFWAAQKAVLFSGTTTVTGLTLFGISQAGALALGAWLLARGEITIGTVYLLVQYTAYLSGPIDGFTFRVRYLQQATAAVNRVVRLSETRSALEAPAHPIPVPMGPLDVTFDSVTFSYDGDEPVFRDLTLEIPAGRILGLVGRTGSGKTTLARLVARQYDCDAGQVRLGGTPVTQFDLDELRSRIAVVTQEVQLFSASIRDNLSLFGDCDDAELLQALDAVGLRTWLTGRPAALDAELDPRSLSAGEAQLLALARSLLRDPGLVLLDEASARLDPLTEHRLQDAIGRLVAGRTAIVIAHRLSTLDRVDDIAVLEGGRLVEHGPREDLVNDRTSAFSRLLSTYRNEVLA
ncbi:MAG: ABC transporter ATP-binding protein/permease [Actinobacteria bacterium]|nr:ABC transporter ATP-binding protein/permease [Actinomycetota bacterium]